MSLIGTSARPPSLSEWIAAALTKEIVLGEIPSGTVLREAEIAQRFSTSRGPCREAFSILARRGFLETGPYRANVVSTLAEQEIRELTECRLIIDPMIASLAAERATEPEIRRLEELAKQAETVAQAGNTSAFYDVVHEVRHVLLLAARNRFLEQLAETIVHQTDRLRLATIQSPTELVQRSNRLMEIVAAVAAGDSEKAAALMREGISVAERRAMESAQSGAIP